ncbi:SpoIIE family protein phosphatase [uncultured Microscilla sp.]|uniref:SpoIIE family protein phosphatase n=1 Tax=uncultured Microscilla sp. TaxID=432653 RepID=UPI002602A611|nr:SpoIIE family protein phosphatase [uncultured Microscilla sp.]
MQKIWQYLVVIIINTHTLWAQTPPQITLQRIDSLTKQLNKPKNHHYQFIRIIEKAIKGLDSTSILKTGTKIASLLQQHPRPIFHVMSPALMAYLYDATQNRTLAIEKMREAIALAQTKSTKTVLAELYRDFGHLQNAANDGNSINSFFASYELFLALGQKAKAVKSLYNVATTQYGANVPINKKIESFREVIKQEKYCQDSLPHRMLINSYNAIGMLYFRQQKYKKAEKELQIALKISEAKKDSAWIGILSGNFSQLYRTNKEYDKALKYLKKDLNLSKKNKERLSLAYVYISFGDIYRILQKYTQAKAYYDSARVESIHNRFTHNKSGVLRAPLQMSYYGLARLFAAQHSYKQAYRYRDLAAKLSDTITQRKLQNKVNQVQAAYNIEKKQKEVLLLTKKNDLKEATIQRQNLINLAIGIVLFFTLVLAIVLYISNKERTKNNKILRQQQDEIVTQNKELVQQREEILAQQSFVTSQNQELSFKNQQIKSSINSALHIQKAILPYQQKLHNLLSDYFVIYRPKDVVSGDFYWINKVKGKTILIAADCTGHGIPGAFMSLICHTLFDKIIRTCHITDSAEILEKAQNEIRELLRQQELGYANGMDVCLVVLESLKDSVKIQFTGARRPLYVIKHGCQTIEELRGDRLSIGGRERRNQVKFSSQQLILKTGSLLYLSSDGYADQNNLNRRPYTTNQLKTTLEKLKDYSMEKQKEILETKLQTHMQGTEQRDDIMLIGVKL